MQTLRFFGGGNIMSQLYLAGQLLPGRFYLYSLRLQHQPLLNSSFSQQQQRSLQDYIETPLMLQYNTAIIINNLYNYFTSTFVAAFYNNYHWYS